MQRNKNRFGDGSFIITQLDCLFSKIKIIDKTIDISEAQQQLLDYYKKKYNHTLARTNFTFIDLFCGAGGLSLGLEQAGLKPVMAIDNNQSALLTYRFNRPWMIDNSVICDDIRNLISDFAFPHASAIVGGPPCQGFSVVNKHKRSDDERNGLYRFYVHSVSQSEPDIFLMENVEGILQLYKLINSDFSKIGYITFKPFILNTKDFGFPQNRKRAFILGVSEKYKKLIFDLYALFKEEICKEMCCKNKYNLGDAILELPALEAKTLKNATYVECAAWGYTFAGFKKYTSEYAKLINIDLPSKLPLLNHRSKYNNERDINIYSILKPGEKSDAESINQINPYKNRADIFRDKFDKLLIDEPCKTITAHMYYDCNMYIHPSQARGLTPREAARVQGFPDDYLFLGSPNEWFRQIGNAVSPLIARVIGKGLNKVLERIYSV